MTVKSDPANIGPVRRAIEALAAKSGLGEAAVGDVGLCVNEAMANVIRHAYSGATDRPIAVGAEFRDGRLMVTIRDWGRGVNPASLPERPYDPCEPGGLGLICLKRMMDDVRYVPQADGGVLLVMSRADRAAPGGKGAAVGCEHCDCGTGDEPSERP